MQPIIAENGRQEYPAGNTSNGREIRIVTTPTGFYQIEALGQGAPLSISEDRFTSLALAKQAVDAWRRANAADYAKEDLKNKIVKGPTIKEQRKAEREAHALTLKNGELSVPEEDEA